MNKLIVIWVLLLGSSAAYFAHNPICLAFAGAGIALCIEDLICRLSKH